VRQRAMVHALRDHGVSRGEWASRIGVPPFVIDKLVQQARVFAPGALAGATRALAEADRALKGDLTLVSETARFTGPQTKALGRELAERVILERTVDAIVCGATSR